MCRIKSAASTYNKNSFVFAVLNVRASAYFIHFSFNSSDLLEAGVMDLLRSHLHGQVPVKAFLVKRCPIWKTQDTFSSPTLY